MKTNDIRVKNLKGLVQESGSQTQLCAETGISASYLSQMLKGTRNIGEKTARNIEIKAGKPELWLDSMNTEMSSIDQELAEALSKVSDEKDKIAVLKMLRGMTEGS